MQISEVISSKMPEPGGFSDLEDITTDLNLIEKYTDLAMSSHLASEARKLSRDSSTEAQEKLYEIGRAQEVYNTLQKNASVSLAAAKSTGVLYRGTYQKLPDLFLGQPWTDRKPRDSSAKAQKKIDELLTQAGFRALRRNSVFTSGAATQASSYGLVYMVFPLDGANITWNSRYHDFYTDVIETGELENVLSGQAVSRNDIYDLRDEISLSKVHLSKLLDLVIRFNQTVSDEVAYNNIGKIYERLSDIIEKYFEYYTNTDKVAAQANRILLAFNSMIAELKKMQKTLSLYAKKFNAKKVQKDLHLIGPRLDAQFAQMGREIKIFLKNTTTPKTPKEIAARAGFVRDNVPQAIKSRNEVYVSGPYYAVQKNSILGRYLVQIIKLSRTQN